MKTKQLNRLLLSIYRQITEAIQSSMSYISDKIGIYKLPISSTVSITDTGVITKLEINVNDLKNGKKYCLTKDDGKSYASNLVISFISYQESLGQYVSITNLTINDFGAIISVDNNEEKKILNLCINNKRYEMNYNDCSSLDTIIITDYSNVNYLETNNETEYIPTKDYHPATKKYVDSSLTNVVYKGDNIPYIKEEKVLCEITEEQLTTAWTKCQASTDSSMYIELPIFNFSEDNFSLHYIFVNGKEYLIEADYNQSYGENNTRHFFEFYSIDDETNNISGGCICTKYDINWDEDTTKVIVKIDRLDDDKEPTFTSSIKLIEKEISPFNTAYLGKNVILDQPVTIGDRKEGVEVGDSSLTIGHDNQAFSSCFAQGYKCEANGFRSFAQGDSCKANGSRSFAQGHHCEVNGDYSSARGFCTNASGSCSYAEGNYTVASSNYQHVQGKYNIEDKNNKYAHIIGNGDCSPKTNNEIVRSNAYTLDWNGNGWYAGKLSQEGNPTEDKDLATKKYVDDNVLTPTAKTLLATLLQNISYSTDQSANVAAFLKELGVDTTQTTK